MPRATAVPRPDHPITYRSVGVYAEAKGYEGVVVVYWLYDKSHFVLAGTQNAVKVKRWWYREGAPRPTNLSRLYGGKENDNPHRHD